MLMTWLFDIMLIALTLSVAALSIHYWHLFTGVVLFIAYGLLLSVIWLRLEAPDVALAEAGIGAGITGALLIATLARLAAQRRDRSEASPER